MTPALRQFWPLRSVHADSCRGTWRVGTLQSRPSPEELQKHLCADALAGSSFAPSCPWLLLQPEAGSCTSSRSRQTKHRGGVSGRAEGSITSSVCAFLTQLAAALPGQHWQPYSWQDALADMAFSWALVYQAVSMPLNKSWPSGIGWLNLTPLRLTIAAFPKQSKPQAQCEEQGVGSGDWA